jgi:hypothetical protein
LDNFGFWVSAQQHLLVKPQLHCPGVDSPYGCHAWSGWWLRLGNSSTLKNVEDIEDILVLPIKTTSNHPMFSLFSAYNFNDTIASGC